MNHSGEAAGNATRDYSACLEGLEQLLAPNRTDFCYGVIPGSPLEPVLRKSVSRENRFSTRFTNGGSYSLYFNDNELIVKSDFAAQAASRGCGSISVFDRASARLERHAREHDLLLNSVPSKIQRRFEDKVFFDRFLRQNNLPVPAGGELQSLNQLSEFEVYPAALQVRDSQGSFGTYFVESAAAAAEVIKKDQLRFPLLLREWIPGPVFGLSIVLGSKNYVFSSVRRQCQASTLDEFEILSGIQWVPTAQLGLEGRRRIEQTMIALADALKANGFQGAAHIDFILQDNKPFIIECNPRPSGSCWQLSQRQELLHGFLFCKEFERSLYGEGPPEHLPTLPDTSFAGATLDFDCLVSGLPHKGDRWKRRNDTGAGVYRLREKALEFKSHSVCEFQEKDDVFVLPAVVPGKYCSTQRGLGLALANSPLYDLNNESTSLNLRGRSLYNCALQLVQ